VGKLLWVCAGGAVGSGARYLIAVWSAKSLGTTFPWGTLLVNLVGSFLLGALMHVGLTTSALSPNVRLALTTGAMGGFTTYSTFSYESLGYFQQSAWGLGALYLSATLVGGLVACFLGLAGARWLLGG
jgi:CrcB protein